MGLPESSRGMRVFKSGSNAKLCSKPIVPGCYGIGEHQVAQVVTIAWALWHN